MNLKERLEDLEASLNDTPKKLRERIKWFLMFAESRGTGHATEHKEWTEKEWQWFKEKETELIPLQ